MKTNYSLYNKNILNNKTPLPKHNNKSLFDSTSTTFNRTSYFNSNNLIKSFKKDESLSVNNVFVIKIPKDIQQLSLRVNNIYSVAKIGNIKKEKPLRPLSAKKIKLKMCYTKPKKVLINDFRIIKQQVKEKISNFKDKLSPVQMNKQQIIEKEVLDDICKLDQFESSKVILELINRFQKGGNKINTKNYNLRFGQ